MPKPRLVILEDEFFAADHLREEVEALGFYVQAVFDNGEAFLKETDWDFDAALVDIFLSRDLTGLDVAKHLKERKKPFLFITANQDSATLKTAAHLAPSAYISKPFKTNDIAAALEMIRHQLVPKIRIRGKSGVDEINPNDIWFIKSDRAYIEIYSYQGKIVQRRLLNEIQEELPDTFVRVHRSYIINQEYMEERSATQIQIKGHSIPISRSYRDNLG
ncbi:response regulator transcription factor [bacterium SCSIO 12741]|nr:response regulator transcription factor [bacterium SCSIO 12741]